MNAVDFTALIHPALAVAVVFPLIGIVTNLALQTRQRRLEMANKVKSKVPAGVGPEHLKYGRWLTNSVVFLSLIGLAHPIFSKMIQNQTWSAEPLRVVFVIIFFIATIAALIALNRVKPKLQRAIFATLTGTGLILLGCQPEVFRRGFEWYTSHYYYGIIAALLMILSQAVVLDIYKDRQNRWRRAHAFLNIFAVLLFIGQGFTGTRDLLEVPLNWQLPYVIQLYENGCQYATPENPCVVQPPPESSGGE